MQWRSCEAVRCQPIKKVPNLIWRLNLRPAKLGTFLQWTKLRASVSERLTCHGGLTGFAYGVVDDILGCGRLAVLPICLT